MDKEDAKIDESFREHITGFDDMDRKWKETLRLAYVLGVRDRSKEMLKEIREMMV